MSLRNFIRTNRGSGSLTGYTRINYAHEQIIWIGIDVGGSIGLRFRGGYSSDFARWELRYCNMKSIVNGSSVGNGWNRKD